MRQRLLGKTGLEVSALGLGGLFVSEVGGPIEQARAAVRHAVDSGINYIDTAPGYANSEEVLGKILLDIDAPLVLSTKLGGRPDPFNPQDRAGLEASVSESLRLLGRDYIDVFMVHEPDRPGQYDWWTDWDELAGPALDLLEDLRRDGTIGHIGLGGTTVHEMTRLIRSGRFDVVLTAFNYSLLWREAGDYVIPAATEQGMGIVVGSPLQQGALARRYDDEIRNGAPWISPQRRAQYIALYDFLDEIDLPLAEVALRFTLSHPDVHCVLSGARSKDEVDMNIAAAERGPLPSDMMVRLDEIHAMLPYRPYEEPFGLPIVHEYRGPGMAR
jgi:aryl-alcohol dehydrogenase-like predicted oxidoreductase